MSVTLKDVGPWSPMIWSIVENCGMTEAGIYGIVSSYSNMKNKKCNASLASIGKIGHVSEDTVRRALKKLIEAGYVKQIPSDQKGVTNTYVPTDKAGLKTVAFDHSDGSSSPDEYAGYGE
jgi:hypothetical protein